MGLKTRATVRHRAWLFASVASAAAAATVVVIALPGRGAVTARSLAASATATAVLAYLAPDTPSPRVAGATTPFTTYQAPKGALSGGARAVSLTAAPTSQFDTPQGEADGHAYVKLTGTGQSVGWINKTGRPINFINVRASIPDAAAGGGSTATLDLYVNGRFRQALRMNSIQSWQYEGDNNYSGDDQHPAAGDPRDFWDEFHAFVSGAPIPAGATLTLRKDAANKASFYWINSVDVWDAPAPATRPANSISIASCGAAADNTPTNGTAAPGARDSAAAIQHCVNEAAAEHKIVWIPRGTFYLKGTSSVVARKVTVEGAGY